MGRTTLKVLMLATAGALAVWTVGCDRADEKTRDGSRDTAAPQDEPKQDGGVVDKVRRGARDTWDKIRSLGEQNVTATVEMTKDHKFSPASVTVKAGEAVLWKNVSDHIHAVSTDMKEVKDPSRVSIPANASPFYSGNVKRGETFTQTFSVPGTYRYVCVLHEDEGMSGSVVVTPKD